MSTKIKLRSGWTKGYLPEGVSYKNYTMIVAIANYSDNSSKSINRGTNQLRNRIIEIMELIKASEVKRKQMYTDDYIANEISLAMHRQHTHIYLNVDLIVDLQIKKLKELGYDTYNNSGRLEISWNHSIII